MLRASSRRFLSSVKSPKELTSDIEFCCLSFGYSSICTTCPFPPELRPHLRSSSSSSRSRVVPHSKSKEHVDACLRLALDPASLRHLTPTTLQQAFTRIALQTHPDTGTTNDSTQFKLAFEAYSVLRQSLKK